MTDPRIEELAAIIDGKGHGRYGLAEIHAFIARLDATARQLRENVNPQLALENALLHLPGASP